MSTSTESPASVTYSVMRNGFNILFTVRGDSGTDLLDTMEVLEKKLTEKGYKAQEKKVFGPKPAPEVVPERKCPTCGMPLIKGKTKDGRNYIKCSTSKYDFATKTSSGCKYFEWVQAELSIPDIVIPED